MKNQPMPSEAHISGPFYHGTKAHLEPGDLLEPGYSSNFGERRKADYIYLTATLDAEPHSPEVIQNMRDHLEELKELGIEAIND